MSHSVSELRKRLEDELVTSSPISHKTKDRGFTYLQPKESKESVAETETPTTVSVAMARKMFEVTIDESKETVSSPSSHKGNTEVIEESVSDEHSITIHTEGDAGADSDNDIDCDEDIDDNGNSDDHRFDDKPVELVTNTPCQLEESNECEYYQKCLDFITAMKIPESAFTDDMKYNQCYCSDCHGRRGDLPCYERGDPPKLYSLPLGWVRFALEVPKHRIVGMKIDRKYHVAYHGTRISVVADIINCGSLLLPGDVALGGKGIEEQPGHYSDDYKPSGFNTKQIFISPSIKYAGHSAYAITKKWKSNKHGKCLAKVAFQVWIRPGSYQVGPETVGAASPIDTHFSNDELEWSTLERPAIVPYGLLVRMKSCSPK